MCTLSPPGVAALLVLGLGAMACTRPIPVGAIVSETGAAAYYGAQVKKGLDLARDEINAARGFEGRPVQLIYEDDATHPEIGLQRARRLIEERGVRIIIGAVSSPVTLRIAPLCERTRTVLLSPSASATRLTQAGAYVFRNYPSDVLEGSSMADFAARDVGLERIVVLAVRNEFGEGLGRVFAEKYEGRSRRIVGRFLYEEGDAEGFDAVVRETRRLDPDGIYLIGYESDVAELVRRIRGAEIRALVLGTSSITDRFARMAGPAAQDVVFPRPSFDPDSPEPAVKAFVLAYRARYAEEPSPFAAHGYDALKLIVVAMERGGSPRPEDVRAGLLQIDDYQGASGRTAFDGNGDVVQYPRLFIIRAGRAEPYDRFLESGGSLDVPGRG